MLAGIILDNKEGEKDDCREEGISGFCLVLFRKFMLHG